jgi:L-ascorbate metabolism protein UlaG (beta-lactamase superfamily)
MDAITKAQGLRKERIQGSPNFKENGVVKNIVPIPSMERPFSPSSMGPMLKATTEYLKPGVERIPKVAPPILKPDSALIAQRQPGLHVTWLGHSTMLVSIDGALFLTDPVFSNRVSPVSWSGPARFHKPPLSLEELPPLDGVVLSHDHYDHLDKAAVFELAKMGLTFYVPLGVGNHLATWGFPPEQVVELDWWESVEVNGVELHAAPARHFSGRGIPGTGNRTLWASWAFIGPQHRAWFSGDTGPFDEGVQEIARRLGPFDLSMIETGAWHPAWGDLHLGPREAVRMHHLVGARSMLPVHWGTFNLALHAWDEPILHVQELINGNGAALHAPIAGGTLMVNEPRIAEAWQDRWTRWRDASPDEAQLLLLPGT